MITNIINKVVDRENLTGEESYLIMDGIMKGEITPPQIASFLTALRMKGETTEEITGFARAMREKAHRIKVSEEAIDTCGTGGDGKHTFNISTAVAFVAAGCGIPVAKHGNRSISSTCGSADVLEKLGVRVDLPPAEVEKCINEIGIGFLFAPVFHPAMKFASPVRKEIGIRTVFNILGPLCNPAEVKFQLMGCYNVNLVEKLAYVLKNLGCISAYVVSSFSGEDEISIGGPTQVAEVRDNIISTYLIHPEDLGINKTSLDKIQGGDARYNANILLGVLQGEKGPYRDAVVLNAAYAISLKTRDIKKSLKFAISSIDEGSAFSKLQKLRDYTK